MNGNACVSECLYDTNLLRRLWTVEKDVYGLTCNVRDNNIIRYHLLEYLLNTFTNFSLSTVLGDKASEVKQP